MAREYSDETPNCKIVKGKKYYYSSRKYNQTYYQKNKAKLLEKVKCPYCGKLVRRAGLSTHQKTKYCQFAQKFIKKSEAKGLVSEEPGSELPATPSD